MFTESALRGRSDQPLGLIETLRYEPLAGCVRQERHLARMSNSARHFGKTYNAVDATAKLNAIDADTPLRVRLYLDEHNDLTVATQPFTPLPNGKFWVVALAQTRVQSTNSLLAYKTSLRATYDAARAEFDTASVDEVLWCNEHGHLCEGVITNLFVQKDKILLTPPLVDGLLRGVLREQLLDTGEAREAVLFPSDLSEFPFFVGNSLRGLVPAKLLQVSGVAQP